jgi:hypothetical protein
MSAEGAAPLCRFFFSEELLELLDHHGIEFDLQYVFD